MRTPVRNTYTAILALLGTAAAGAGPYAAAQVEIVFANASGSSGSYGHALTVLDGSGGERPLAQLRPPSPVLVGSPTTGAAIRRPIPVDLGGVPYLYWCTNLGDALWRATDRNGNGALDPVELELVWAPAVTMGPDALDHDPVTGRFVIANDQFGVPGVWLLEDLNGDGDMLDAGEARRIVDSGPTGNTAVVQGVTVSIDDIEGAAFLSAGEVIFYEEDDEIWYRYDLGTGTIAPWLNYQGLNNTIQFPRQTAFGTTLPAVTVDLSIATVDRTASPPAVYVTAWRQPFQPFVFRAVDVNADGDVNDAGEVTLFFDSTAFSFGTRVDDIHWFGSSLWLTSEDPMFGGSPSWFLTLTDGNGDGDALDPGEQAVFATLPAAADPDVGGLTVVPAGAFGPAGCVRFDLADSGLSASGGNVFFFFDDIPQASATGSQVGFVALSLTRGGAFALGPGCILGLTPDLLTAIQLAPGNLPLFLTPPLTFTSTSVALTAPPLPPGLAIDYAGLIFDPAMPSLVSQSSRLVVR